MECKTRIMQSECSTLDGKEIAEKLVWSGWSAREGKIKRNQSVK